MAKVFRSWPVDQGWWLPPSLHEIVPPGHMAHFARDTVREALDLSAILDVYTEKCGYPPYGSGLMVALLLYGYSHGLYSLLQLARACEERLDVMVVTGLNRPDFRTISDFRKGHLVALSDRGGSGNLHSGHKWIADLTAAILAASRRQDEQASAPEPLPGVQGQGSLGCREGREDAGRPGAAV